MSSRSKIPAQSLAAPSPINEPSSPTPNPQSGSTLLPKRGIFALVSSSPPSWSSRSPGSKKKAAGINAIPAKIAIATRFTSYETKRAMEPPMTVVRNAPTLHIA